MDVCRAERTKQAGTCLSPSDQQERTDRVERSPTPLTCTNGISDVQSKRDRAGCQQQATRRLQHVAWSAAQREVPGTHQQTQNGQVNRGRHERGNVGRNPIRRAKARTFPNPKRNVSPITTPITVVTNLVTLDEVPITTSLASTRGRKNPQ